MQSVYDRLNRRAWKTKPARPEALGLKWISADEFAENEKQRKAAEQEMNLKQRDLQRAARVGRRQPPSWKRETRRQEGSLVLLRVQTRFDTAQRRFDAALKEYQKLAASGPPSGVSDSAGDSSDG